VSSEPETRPDTGGRWVWWLAAGLVAALVAWRYAPRWSEPFRPRPLAAWVAILPEGGATATDGRHELEAGRAFRLFAVLEAEAFGGERVYFTEAPALSLGGRDVPPESLRPWPGSRRALVRWLTVEGFAPYLAVASAADADRFRLVENFHPEWGSGWSTAGAVDPRLALLEAGSPLRPLPFGTQRYAVRIELFDEEGALTPSARWSSAAAEVGSAETGRLPTVVAALPEPLAAISAAFGRTQLAPAPDLAREIDERLDALVASELAFEGPTLLAAHLAAAGTDAEALAFRTVTLSADGPRWGEQVEPGDLLRAGGRIVVLYRDADGGGRLDPGDLVFDLDRGLRVLAAAAVFESEGGELRLDHARRTTAAPPPA
jgi:hypothetical protein